jgi:SAM-dependent methyltransferase
MTRMTDLAHRIVAAALRRGDWAVDATVGNGHDTTFLLSCVGEGGRVFGFDIQPAALAATAQRVGPHVTLFEAGHETLRAHLPHEASGQIGAVMFNLGYLPGSDKATITRPQTTLAALTQAVELLRDGGVVSIMIYAAHAGGADERDAVLAWAAAREAPLHVTHHRTIAPARARQGPELIVVARR